MSESERRARTHAGCRLCDNAYCHCHWCHTEHIRQLKENAAVIHSLMVDLGEARDRAREYLPHVKYSYDNMNKGRASERDQRSEYTWLGESDHTLDDIPNDGWETYEEA